MFSSKLAISNEVPGSFWKSDSDMSKVPEPHVIGFKPEINVTISDVGRQMAKTMQTLSNDVIRNKCTGTEVSQSVIDITL